MRDFLEAAAYFTLVISWAVVLVAIVALLATP